MNNPVDYEINKELGECYLFMGEYEKARDYYQKAVACNPDMAEPFLGLAAVSLGLGDMNNAYTLYSKANTVQSTDCSLAGMGMIECENGQHEVAYQHFIDALHINPGNMVAVNGMLQLSHFLGRLPNALPYLEKALEAGTSDIEAIRYAFAGCLAALGRDAEAKGQLELLIGANPNNSVAQQLYAQFAA